MKLFSNLKFQICAEATSSTLTDFSPIVQGCNVTTAIEQSAKVIKNNCDGGMTLFCLLINNYLTSIIISNV